MNKAADTPLDDSLSLDEVLLGISLWARPVIRWYILRSNWRNPSRSLQHWLRDVGEPDTIFTLLDPALYNLRPAVRCALCHLIVQDGEEPTAEQRDLLEAIGWLQRDEADDLIVPEGVVERFLTLAKLAVETETWEKAEAQKKETT